MGWWSAYALDTFDLVPFNHDFDVAALFNDKLSIAEKNTTLMNWMSLGKRLKAIS